MNFEVIYNIFPLLDTMEEGILHLKKQTFELRYEEAFVSLQDLVEAMGIIENVIYPMQDKLPKNNINLLLDKLKENINKAINSYEYGKEVMLEGQLENQIYPVFINWKEEIEMILKPYILS